MAHSLGVLSIGILQPPLKHRWELRPFFSREVNRKPKGKEDCWMKRILVAFVMVAVCGCTSYRFTGSVDGASMANGVKTKGKYRIYKLSFDVKRGLNQQIRDSQGDGPFAMPDPWSLPQVASASREACLIEMIHATHPDVFSSVSTAIPLEIKVQGGRENKDYGWSVLLSRPVIDLHSISSRRVYGEGQEAVFAGFKAEDHGGNPRWQVDKRVASL